MKIFVIYASEDREAAELIKEKLETTGHEVWIDSEGIAGGHHWLEHTETRIEDSAWIIVLVSPHSTESQWVRMELSHALTLGKRILPIVIEPTALPKVIANYEFVDASGNLARIAENLADLLPKRSQPAPESTPAATAALEELQDEIAAAPLPDRIFIAYARQQRSLAAALAEMLHSCGKSVFYDAHIRAGAQWRKIIQSALDDATHLIVIWTPEARDSDEVEREVSYALAQGITIIPLLSREIPKLPYHLHGLHYLILADNIDTVKSDLLAAIDQRSNGESNIWH